MQSLIPYDAEVSVGFGFIGMQNDNRYAVCTSMPGELRRESRAALGGVLDRGLGERGVASSTRSGTSGWPWIGRSADRCTRSRRT